jgi:hypothetical protein
VAIAVATLFALITARAGRGKPERAWPIFVAGCVAFFSLNVLGQYYFNFRISGEPARLVPELDLALILGALVVLGWLWNRGGVALRIVAAALTIAAFIPSLSYVRNAWTMFPVSPNYQDRVEYRVSDWIWKNMPDARSFPIGSVRIWFDVWHDLAELGGGSDQGLLNSTVQLAQWEIVQDTNPELAVLWLKCMAVDLVYVSDKQSEEAYHDFKDPKKFVGVLPAVFDDGKGNVIYKVPRRFLPRVRIVDTARLNAAQPPQSIWDHERLSAYADMVEHGPDSPAVLTRNGTDAIHIQAKVAPDQSIVVQESYDPAWQASSGGKPLAVRKDAMGFMAIDAPPGDQDIALIFATPLENKVGRVLTVAGLVAVIGLLVRGIR